MQPFVYINRILLLAMLSTVAIASVGCVPHTVSDSQSPVTDEFQLATATAIEPKNDIDNQQKPIVEEVADSQRPMVIAVCPRPFQAALRPWATRREREGLEVRVIDSQPTAESLKQALANSSQDRCDYILLVGDAPHTPADQTVDAEQFVPTIYRQADVTAQYQQSGQLPGDHAYGDFDDDGIVDAAVGRIPAKSPEQLSAFIERIIAYEDSTHFGRWRSRVDFIAGIGGFGPVIDGAIEMVAGGMITGSLPGNVRTRITHASPTSDFSPAAEQFTAKVLENYRDGARFWVYAGHGWVNELDRVPPTQFGRPILAMSDIADLQRPAESAPIALMLACYTGAFELPEDCLAERMLLSENGPIAILAGSRVTMPYGNSATAIGLIHAVYDQSASRLGDAWLKTLQELQTPTGSDAELQSRRMVIDGLATVLGGATRIDDERREHMQLYNWLGDPTLRLLASQQVEIDSPSDRDVPDAIAGQSWSISGITPIAGTMTVEMHRRLGTAIGDASESEASKNDASESDSRYLRANATVLVSQTFPVAAGRWTCQFPELPTVDAKTSQMQTIIKIDVVGISGFASGSRAVWLRAAK